MGAPLSWDAGRLDGTPWQGIRFLSIEFFQGSAFPAVVTAHLNQPDDRLTADDVAIGGGRRLPAPDREVLIDQPGVDGHTVVIRFRGFGDHSPYTISCPAAAARRCTRSSPPPSSASRSTARSATAATPRTRRAAHPRSRRPSTC